MAKNKGIVKSNSAIVKSDDEESVILTEKQVWDVIEFSRSLSNAYGSMYMNPELLSARMRDINLNPLAATQTMLDEAMQSPKDNEKNLQEFSQSFELTSMVYKRLLSYLGNMLAFDITYTSNAEVKDYATLKYKRELEAIEEFLDRFDYLKEFRIVVKEMLRNDAYFGCMRDVGDAIVLQELPSQYCKITGRWGNGFLFSFNMYWFMQPGVDLDLYPPFFKEKFNEIWGMDGKKPPTYDPGLPPELRGNSSWIYWVDVPVTIGVCFKLTPELATRLPYFTPLFNDLILQPLMRTLQKNVAMASASKIIMGEVPYLNKEAKATVKDSIAISPDLLGKFMALVKSALSDSVKIASAPLENMQGIEFKSDNEMYDSYLRTALASSGINTNLIFSSDIKPNAIETQLSLNVDEQMMTALYDQFGAFMNYWASRYTQKYKFRFEFEGTTFFLNREFRYTKAMDLFDNGIVLPQKIAASLGMKPSVMRKHMEEAKGTDFMGMLTNPMFIQQDKIAKQTAEANMQTTEANISAKVATSGGAGSAPKGRPRKKDSELSDEGDQTRAQGTNIGRGGKV